MTDDYGFWPRANQALTAARAELDSGDDTRLPYAALRLRMAIEALVYERAHALREMLPTEQIAAWQPKKVLEALLEVDRTADQGGALWVGIEDTPGVPAKDMQFIGQEHVFSLKMTKKHYDALGSHLHQPTLKQFLEGAASNNERLRQRCEEIATEVHKALFSSLRNFFSSVPVSFECQKCRSEVARKLPTKAFDFTIKCLVCGAEYRVVSEDGRTTTCYPLTKKVPCRTDGCDGEQLLWQHEIEVGTEWECEKCHRQYEIGMRIFEKPPPAKTAE